MKITEIREKTSEQLTELLKEQKAELFNLRFQHAIHQLDNSEDRRNQKDHRQNLDGADRKTGISGKEQLVNGKKSQKNQSRYRFQR